MTQVVCEYANECTNNNSYMCSSCRHNRGKKNHYEPVNLPWYPKPYPNPWQPTWIEIYKDKTEYRLGPEPVYKLGPKPSQKLGLSHFEKCENFTQTKSRCVKTPYFLS